MSNGRESNWDEDDEISGASQQFYKVLVLLNTITSSIENAKTYRSEWQQFLDGISWLCDEKPGGKTVTSIAVSQAVRKSIFWIACNARTNDERTAYLRDILQDLRRLSEPSPPNIESIGTTIANKSIKRSFRRVANYLGRLKVRLEEIETLYPVSEDIGESMTDEFDDSAYIKPTGRGLRIRIENMIQSCSQEEMCLKFYKFRYSPDFRRLVLHCNAQVAGAQEAWQSVRHLIGRLGSWHSATKIALTLATREPVLIQNSVVRPIDHFNAIRLNFKLRDLTLTSVVREAFPERNIKHAIRAVDAVFRKDDSNLGHEFQNCKKQPFKPKVHAEAAMADHFYSRQLQFWDGDRYIGCSKSSCFCCSLYLRYHAGMYIDRPCHGNIWINWCPTSPALIDDVMRVVPTATVIRNMVEKIQSEMERLILSSLRLQRNQLESTTGISSGNLVMESTDRSTETSLRIW